MAAEIKQRSLRPNEKTEEPTPEPASALEQTPEPVAEAKPETPVEAPDTVARPQGFVAEDDYEGRYKALRASRNEDRRRADALEKEVETLKARVSELSAKPAPETKPFEIDSDTRAQLGEAGAKTLETFASATNERIEQLQAELQAREQRERERFFSDLDSLAPVWRQLNNDPMFIGWLQQVDSSTGQTKQALLNGYVEENDPRSAARLFELYTSAYASAAPDTSRQPVGQNPISPEPITNRGSAPMGGETNMIEMYSPQEIKDFFEQKSVLYRKGHLKGERLKEIQTEEAKIRKAMAEGRIG